MTTDPARQRQNTLTFHTGLTLDDLRKKVAEVRKLDHPDAEPLIAVRVVGYRRMLEALLDLVEGDE